MPIDHDESVDDDDDDDDDVILDMQHKVTPHDPTILQLKSDKNTQCIQNTESIFYNAEVTRFEALISALMGVDTIYFKWRRV